MSDRLVVDINRKTIGLAIADMIENPKNESTDFAMFAESIMDAIQMWGIENTSLDRESKKYFYQCMVALYERIKIIITI